MTTITDYFEQAQLSMAAYALGLQPGMSNLDYRAALEDKGMSAKQAEEFARKYSIVDQYTDFFSGFSGTVFADSSGTKYFAIRGSEASIIDWLGTNFGNIGTDGIAISQGIAMFNWLQRLYGSNGIDVVQYSYSAITRTISTFADTANGRLVGQLTPISVAGHSLGGHLSMIMSRLAPGKVSSVYTYNAPGFDPFGTGLTSEGFFDLLRNAPLGLTGSIGTTWNNSPMSNWNVEGDVVHNIGFTPGDPGIIFSESAKQGVYDAHIKEPIVDSLALYNLFATLDPTLNTNPAAGMPKITDILKASASNEPKTLEATLADLATLFQWDYRFGQTSNTDITATTDDREDFYTRLFSLESYLKTTPFYNSITQSFSFTVDSLVNQSTTHLITAAQSTDLATRYALYKLNPFTVSGAGRPESLGLVRKTAAAYRHRAGCHENENSMKEAA